ncbi:MAG: helix-turn-helix domain-containing protein [Acidobacteriota bacterium]
MQTLGVKLRLERERQNIAIEKIASDTRIHQRYLEAIEADDHASLPGEFFYRAFVRQYAKYLGWNAEEAERQIRPITSAFTAETTEASGDLLGLTGDEQMTALRNTLKDKPMRAPQDDGMSKGWLVFAATVVVLCGAYFGWRNFQPGSKGTAAVEVAAKPPVVEEKAAPVETVVPAESKAEKRKLEEKRAEAVAAGPEAGKFMLTVRAREMTWIRLTADGNKVHGGTLDPGQERTVSAASVELIVGNAGTLDVIYNGKPITYGNKGEVKTLLLSPEGWKYKPKAPSAEPAVSPTSTAGEGSAGVPAARALE